MNENVSASQPEIVTYVPGKGGLAHGDGQPLETRPPMIGGEVWRPRLACCLPGHFGGAPGESRRAKGGEAAVRAGSGRLTDQPFSAWRCLAMAPHGGCRDGERGARRASRDGYLVFDGIECKCENANVSCMDCNLNARVKCKRPPDFSGGRLCFQMLVAAQLAATARPLRAAAAATRSTSASAATRASATHFWSTTVRP